MRKPEFITFTGADDHTNLVEMETLSKDYPIEWGILWSQSRQGQPRYPTQRQFALFNHYGVAGYLTVSAHICGDDAKVLNQHGDNNELDGVFNGFRRAQINIASKPDAHKLWHWGAQNGLKVIAQARGEFPEDRLLDWLYDPSGGRGVAQTEWPKAPTNARLVGYAGGLGPGSDWAAIAEAAGDTPYWIDMETRVRDEEDQFSLALCRKVCEEVYG